MTRLDIVPVTEWETNGCN